MARHIQWNDVESVERLDNGLTLVLHEECDPEVVQITGDELLTLLGGQLIDVDDEKRRLKARRRRMSRRLVGAATKRRGAAKSAGVQTAPTRFKKDRHISLETEAGRKAVLARGYNICRGCGARLSVRLFSAHRCPGRRP